MVRIFVFKNTYICENMEKINADYSAFGYFDGLSMEVYQDNKFPISVSDFGSNEQCDHYCIAAFRKDSKTDADFWKAGNEPYIFISFLRLSKASNKLSKIVDEIENNNNAVCYHTLDNSDLLVCIRRKRYSEGYFDINSYYDAIQKIDPGNSLQKGFSVMVISQAVLNQLANEAELKSSKMSEEAAVELTVIGEEIISCSLRGIIRKWDEFSAFMNELKLLLNSQDVTIKEYGVLGSDDLIIEIDHVSANKFFRLFGDGMLLTHGNSIYRNAFYNLKTEIFMSLSKG